MPPDTRHGSLPNASFIMYINKSSRYFNEYTNMEGNPSPGIIWLHITEIVSTEPLAKATARRLCMRLLEGSISQAIGLHQ